MLMCYVRQYTSPKNDIDLALEIDRCLFCCWVDDLKYGFFIRFFYPFFLFHYENRTRMESYFFPSARDIYNDIIIIRGGLLCNSCG